MYTPIIILLLALFSVPIQAASAPDWRSRSIYQVVTDRFARTDGSTTFPCVASDRLYCGGTWRGIINQLDYITDMGFTAIWISPIQQQVDGNTYEGEAYHGYWPTNLYQLNTHFGDEQDLLDLISECHSRDILVMLDMVFNHLACQGEDVKWADFVPFDSEQYFHPRCPIDWGNETSIEDCWMGDGYVSLADVDTENAQVVSTLESYVSTLVAHFDVDGLRLDACRNIPKPFWQRISRAAGVYCQGEVWVADPDFVAPYQEYMDGLHNYPVKEAATAAFVSSSGNLSFLIDVATQMQTLSQDITLFGSFMENHDNPRLGSLTTDLARLSNLATYNILADGIPIVYYGQEQMFSGNNDPTNREALWLSGYATTGNLVPTFTALNLFRNHITNGGGGSVADPVPFLTTLAKYTVYSNPSVVSVRKGSVVLVLTNSGSDADSGNAVIEGFLAGVELVEILSCGNLIADGQGEVSVMLEGGAPMVLYPTSLLLGSGLCGL